mmetsp:Transcript_60306/g.161827  ORF Transcript_60306/g.161827 Transcript_60306/m.161827 type:complete len:274 (-) Transcript_60306:49-870(-)
MVRVRSLGRPLPRMAKWSWRGLTSPCRMYGDSLDTVPSRSARLLSDSYFFSPPAANRCRAARPPSSEITQASRIPRPQSTTFPVFLEIGMSARPREAMSGRAGQVAGAGMESGAASGADTGPVPWQERRKGINVPQCPAHCPGFRRGTTSGAYNRYPSYDSTTMRGPPGAARTSRTTRSSTSASVGSYRSLYTSAAAPTSSTRARMVAGAGPRRTTRSEPRRWSDCRRAWRDSLRQTCDAFGANPTPAAATSCSGEKTYTGTTASQSVARNSA